MKKILIICAIAIGGLGLSGITLSLRNQTSESPSTPTAQSTPVTTPDDNVSDDLVTDQATQTASQPSGSTSAASASTPAAYTEPQHKPNGNLITKVIDAIKKLVPGGKKEDPRPAPDNKPEPPHPAGRFRNPVFNAVQSHKDLTFESTFETQIVTDQDGFKSLRFNEQSPKDLKLNIYQPVGDTAEKRPLLIFVYGGGWVLGDRYQQEAAAEYYARLGYVTATIDYTMMPPDNHENPVMNPDDQPAIDVYTTIFYESAQDIYAAYQYLEAHQSYYKIDPTRVGLAGWSAGGQISNTLTHFSPMPSIPGLRGVVGSSSILMDHLAFTEPFNGYKTFTSAYRPISLFASYDNDTGFAGQPNDHAADCDRLDKMGHPCITVTFPGYGHDLFFEQAPLKDHTVDFLATHVAGH